MSRNLRPNIKADILIIDDTPDNLRLLNQILNIRYKVRLAPSGAIGLQAARSAPPDLILLDVMMPEMNGYEVAAQLKAAPQTRDTPIIFISALNDPESKVRGFAAGGVDYVTKPFQETEVLARVNTHISLHALYQQAQSEIAERKRAEEALRESNTLLSSFIRYSPIYAYIKQVAPTESRVLYASENLGEMLGIPVDMLPGKNMEELFPPEFSAKIALDDWTVVSSGAVLKLDEDLNGRNYTTIKFPILQGSKTLLAGYSIDMTERKKMEESLMRRNQEMATLHETSLEINSLSDVSVLLNAIVQRACELLKIPAGALYLVRQDEEQLELVVGHNTPPQWLGVKNKWDTGLAGRVVQTRKIVAVEDYLTWEGRLGTFLDNNARRMLAVPLKIHDQITGVIILVDKQPGIFDEDEVRLASLFADLAAIAATNAEFASQLEKRVAQRTSELELAVKELESLSYTVSHDLRSPMRAIVGYSKIIRDEYPESLPPEVLRWLGLMNENALFMGAMIDGLLKFMQLNRKTLKIEVIQPESLVQQALNILNPEQNGRRVEIDIKQLPACRGDAELLLDVWYNLISNAIKFSRLRDVARIEVGCLAGDGQSPVYYVKDNGVGFSMEHSGKLYKVFHRLHHVSEFDGIGMGLALTQRIISRHGGRIWVEAVEGDGAVFYFSLG